MTNHIRDAFIKIIKSRAIARGAPLDNPLGRADESQAINDALLDFSRNNLPGDIAMALEAGADLEARGQFGARPLALACGTLNPYSVKALLDAGADPNARDEELGRAPLHWVAIEAAAGRPIVPAIDIAKMLVASGADITARDSTSKTPLQLAQPSASAELARILSGASEPQTPDAVFRQAEARARAALEGLPPPPPGDKARSQAFRIAELCAWIARGPAERAAALAAASRRPVCALFRTDWARDYEAPLLKALADAFNRGRAEVCEELGLIEAIGKIDPEKKARASASARGKILSALDLGQSAVMLATETMSIDPILTEIVGVEITIERFDEASLGKACGELRGLFGPMRFEPADWIAMVGIHDLMATAGCEDSELEQALKEQVEQRVESLRPQDKAISLGELHGLGAAKQWAQNLIADMKAARRGEIGWDQVDCGALLEGPPGVGKTTIARAIANDSGMRMVATTATSWQSAGHLGDVLQAIEKDFQRAAELAPCIVFIDEIDAIGSRAAGASGSQDQWVTWSVNHLLALMDGFNRLGRGKVVVLGATNHAGKVDPALRRSGRLDRLIKIPLPNRPALAAIYGHYLRGFEHGLEESDVSDLAQCSVGASGADVERYVREGRRRARSKGRLLNKADILESVYATPPEELRQPMLPEELENTAWHEAGHAVMAWAGPEKASGLNYISVVPRADGSLGFISQASKEGRYSITRAQAVHRLEVLMAGRAAEELRFGKGGVTGGCSSDLAAASDLAQKMIGEYGLGKSGRLSILGGRESADKISEAIETELQEAYSSALSALETHRPLLASVAAALIDKSEITGPEFALLAASYQKEPETGKGEPCGH